MDIGIRGLTKAAKLQEWSERIMMCRSSGKSVRAWCEERGICQKTYYRWEKRVIQEAVQQPTLPTSTQPGLLMQINPNSLPDGKSDPETPEIIVRHGESTICFPNGSSIETIADFVKALNHYV